MFSYPSFWHLVSMVGYDACSGSQGALLLGPTGLHIRCQGSGEEGKRLSSGEKEGVEATNRKKRPKNSPKLRSCGKQSTRNLERKFTSKRLCLKI